MLNIDEVPKREDKDLKDCRYLFLDGLAMLIDEGNSATVKFAEQLINCVKLTDINNLRTLYERLWALVQSRLSIDDDHYLHREVIAIRKYILDNNIYSVLSYRTPIQLEKLLDATSRHFLQILLGEDYDKETSVSHFGHIACNILMMLVQIRLHHNNEEIK